MSVGVGWLYSLVATSKGLLVRCLAVGHINLLAWARVAKFCFKRVKLLSIVLRVTSVPFHKMVEKEFKAIPNTCLVIHLSGLPLISLYGEMTAKKPPLLF